MGLFGFTKKSEKATAAAHVSDATALPPGQPSPPKGERGAAPGKAVLEKIAAKSSSSAGEWRVVFVGGEQQWFRTMSLDVRNLQPGWQCLHVGEWKSASGASPGHSLEGMILDGALLEGEGLKEELSDLFGHRVCVIRCDTGDRTAAARWTSLGGIPVARDADASALVSALRKARQVREWNAHPEVRKLLSLVRKLPTVPKLHEQITAELRSPDYSIDAVAWLISREPVMSAKILQMVNSAFLGQAHEINEISQAVMVLGTERIQSLILLTAMFSQYDSSKCPGFSAQVMWGHSLRTGAFARAIALGETMNASIAEPAFTAGLLHDVGKLVLAGNAPEMYGSVIRARENKKIPNLEAEMEVLGTTHATFGACLLAAWGLPLSILEAIAWHHDPGKSPEKAFSLLAVVHAANSFAHESNSAGVHSSDAAINRSYLESISKNDCINRWRGYCGLPPLAKDASTVERIQQRVESKEN